MKKHIYNSLIAFFGGSFGVSVIFIVYYSIFRIPYIENPFPATFLGIFLWHLLGISFVEEGTKFLLIKRDIGQFPYAFFLGLGFGVVEAILSHPFTQLGIFERRIPAIILHITTATILAYTIKKNKPFIGLPIAITLHTGFNLVSHYAGAQ